MPECPVCLENKGHRSMLKMPCQHGLCFECASNWLPQHGICPLCRGKNECYSLGTRSKSKANALLFVLRLYLQEMTSSTVAHEENDEDEFLKDFIEVLELLILPYRHLWYRPQLNIYVKMIHKILLNKIDKIRDELVDCPLQLKTLGDFLETF